jgi:hypothetical protein
MKLAKLLGLGSSFFGGGEMAAYRLNKRGCLPKFNEGKNPFAPKDAGAAPEEPKPKAAALAVAPGPKAPPPYAFKPLAQAVKYRPAVPEASAPVAKAARPGWTTRLNPFRAPEPVAAQPPSAVQVELSLHAVKVMHNDLADADVEIVPVKARAEAPPAAVLPPARQAWEYLGENLLKSSR